MELNDFQSVVIVKRPDMSSMVAGLGGTHSPLNSLGYNR